MRKVIKATFPMIAGLIFLSAGNSFSQQNVIANKDNTRPELNREIYAPARITSFTATRNNGYNDIRWATLSEESTRRFIVEYSYDGINFMSAGQALSSNSSYTLNHSSLDTRPMLYRIRIEDHGQRSYFSDNVFLDGIAIAPVEIYPTIVTGDVVNVNAAFPVERITITAGDSRQVFAKDLNGVRDFIPIVIPSLNRGMYFMTFYGNGWKHTQQFIVGG
jgi:hypothetical protein